MIILIKPLHKFDLDDPTNPENYIADGPLKGQALFWANDLSGVLRDAIIGFMRGSDDEKTLKITIAYLQYVINAPCWLEECHYDIGTDHEQQIETLRLMASRLKTRSDINILIGAALTVGIDPL